MINPTFRNIYRVFVLSFKLGRNMATRNTFNIHYLPLIEIKDFNILIDNRLSLVQPVKSKQEMSEKCVKMPRNNDYTTGHLFDYLHHQNYYKLIGTDLSRQINTSYPHQINLKRR